MFQIFVGKMQLQVHMHVQVYLDFLHMKIFYFVEDVILVFLYIVEA